MPRLPRRAFSYALAKVRDAPLLFIGNDFAASGIVAALARGGL